MPDAHATHSDARTQYQPLQLAGMALRNGVLVIGPTHWGAAVRTSSGEIKTAARRRPAFGRHLYEVPGLRGVARISEMMAVLPALRLALPQARLPFESTRMVSILILTSGAAKALRRKGAGSVAAAAAVDLATGAVNLAAVLASLSSDDLSKYHGAEHKAIGGYEQGIAAADASKEHERCGSHLAIPLLLVNTVTLQAAKLLLPRNPRMASTIGAVAGLAAGTELVRSMQKARKSGNPTAEALQSIGTRLQSVASTREPNPAQLEVARQALATLLKAEKAEQPALA